VIFFSTPLLYGAECNLYNMHTGYSKDLQPILKKQNITLAQDMVKTLQPKTGLETMLATQMANLHVMQSRLMLETERWGFIQTDKTSCSLEYLQHKMKITHKSINAITKIANATTQMALALDKLQTQRQQPPSNINRVNVESGGQAVVAGVINANPKDKKGGDTS